MIYHIAWMTVGNTILLNLLMGIMLDSMKDEDDNVEKDFNKMKKKHVEDMRKKEGQVLIDHFLINQIQLNRKSSALGGKRKKKQKKDDNVLDESFEFDPDIFTQKVNFNFSKRRRKTLKAITVNCPTISSLNVIHSDTSFTNSPIISCLKCLFNV